LNIASQFGFAGPAERRLAAGGAGERGRHRHVDRRAIRLDAIPLVRRDIAVNPGVIPRPGQKGSTVVAVVGLLDDRELQAVVAHSMGVPALCRTRVGRSQDRPVVSNGDDLSEVNLRSILHGGEEMAVRQRDRQIHPAGRESEDGRALCLPIAVRDSTDDGARPELRGR
jgi:hypothetical protein